MTLAFDEFTKEIALMAGHAWEIILFIAAT